MERGKKPIIGKKTCIVICWFLVGFIGAQIYFSYLDVPGVEYRIEAGIGLGIAYIIYPFSALRMLITSIFSGREELLDDVGLLLGMLGVIYILIPVVVSIIYNRMKK